LGESYLRDSRDIIRRLLANGFVRHKDIGRIVILPHPRKDIPVGTVRSI
jgi:predicted RNA binding protein YcfA (HicA-like mRNA interferase family)